MVVIRIVEIETMRAIDEIWIVKPGGLTIFNKSKNTIDPILIGGFFSAIQTFIEQIGETELKTLQLGDSKITIYQGRQGYLFIARSGKKPKDHKIIASLKLVEAKFFEHYGKYLNESFSDIDLFNDFSDIIEEIFKDTPEKRAEEALW
ncbi:MAG: hypothetical protein ACTSRS_12705 [Candidatus Helarchaeota archaeon]